jgi:hypothetical protein
MAISYLPVASAQTNSASTATVSTGTNIPPPTGCTAPGYQAPASLLNTLGSNKSVSEGLTFANPPKSDRPYEYLTLGGGLVLVLLIFVGIIWAIAIGIRRLSRRNNNTDLEVQAKKRSSHTSRNVYLVLLVIAIIATGAGLSVLSPYVIPKTEYRTVPNGMVQNIASPYDLVQLNPQSIKYYYAPAYVNNETTLLEGNFTVTSGGSVLVVVVPDSLRPQFFADLQNGTLTGASGCTMAGISVYYDSGAARSGAFAVAIPAVSNQTTYDVIIANPSGNQTVTLRSNVFWGY